MCVKFMFNNELYDKTAATSLTRMSEEPVSYDDMQINRLCLQVENTLLLPKLLVDITND